MSRFLEAPINQKTEGASRVVLKTRMCVNDECLDESTVCERDNAHENEPEHEPENEHDNRYDNDMTEIGGQDSQENVKTPVAQIGSNLTAEQRKLYEILLSRLMTLWRNRHSTWGW